MKTVRDLSVRAGNALHAALFGHGAVISGGSRAMFFAADGDKIRERLENRRKEEVGAGRVFMSSLRRMLAAQRGCGAVTLRELMVFLGEAPGAEPRHVCVCRTCGKKVRGRR